MGNYTSVFTWWYQSFNMGDSGSFVSVWWWSGRDYLAGFDWLFLATQALCRWFLHLHRKAFNHIGLLMRNNRYQQWDIFTGSTNPMHCKCQLLGPNGLFYDSFIMGCGPNIILCRYLEEVRGFISLFFWPIKNRTQKNHGLGPLIKRLSRFGPSIRASLGEQVMLWYFRLETLSRGAPPLYGINKLGFIL